MTSNFQQKPIVGYVGINRRECPVFDGINVRSKGRKEQAQDWPSAQPTGWQHLDEKFYLQDFQIRDEMGAAGSRDNAAKTPGNAVAFRIEYELLFCGVKADKM